MRRGGAFPARAGCTDKFVYVFGENARCSVGADASVRPMGNGKFAAAYHKKRKIVRHAVGEGFYPSRARCTGKIVQ